VQARQSVSAAVNADRMRVPVHCCCIYCRPLLPCLARYRLRASGARSRRDTRQRGSWNGDVMSFITYSLTEARFRRPRTRFVRIGGTQQVCIFPPVLTAVKTVRVNERPCAFLRTSIRSFTGLNHCRAICFLRPVLKTEDSRAIRVV